MHGQPGNDAPQWMQPAGLIAVVIGGVGFIASGAIGGGPTLAGALAAGALNPLFFIGVPLGLYWLYRTGFFVGASTGASTGSHTAPLGGPGKPPVQNSPSQHHAPLDQIDDGELPLLEPAPFKGAVTSVNPVPYVLAFGLGVGAAGVVLGVLVLGYFHNDRDQSAIRRTAHDSKMETSTDTTNGSHEVKQAADESKGSLCWTLGATRGSVREIEGPPTFVQQDRVWDTEVWTYATGDRVIFDVATGRAVEWSNKNGSLHAVMPSDGGVATPRPGAFFTVGSSREDVARAQGTPHTVSLDPVWNVEVWMYGTSDSVRFDSKTGNVVEWDNRSGGLRTGPH
jgi:hypothetical protein